MANIDGSLWNGFDPRMLRQPGEPDAQANKNPYAPDAALLGLSIASTTAPDLLAPWGGSVATGTLGSNSMASSTLPRMSADMEGWDEISTMKYNQGLTGYPRIITAMELLGDSDDDSTWCGPPSTPEETAAAQKRSFEAWNIQGSAEEKRERPKTAGRREGGGAGAAVAAAAAAAAAASASTGSALHPAGEGRGRERPQREPREDRRNRNREDRPKREPGEGQSRRAPQLILPRGDIPGDNQKFICVFQVGLDDDEEFCLVKRILGKAGNNMRRIAEECSAKVRLRGIGSGFLEGADGKEANMPLQLNVSCSDFDSYQGAVDRVSTLLKDLYKHYRRYSRAKGVEPPDVKIQIEEVRRDDVGLDLLQQKAQRSPSQRERDRKAREKERQLFRERERERAALRDREAAKARKSSRERERERRRNDDEDEDGTKGGLALPGGLAMPTTPAGRREAAKSGGAEHAAIVSAAAREAERTERDRARKDRDDQREKEKEERDKKKREAANRAAAVMSRSGRGGVHAAAKAAAANTSQSSSTAKPADAGNDSWSSWKGPNTWENWDPWANAASKNHSDNASHDAKGKGKGTERAPPPPPPEAPRSAGDSKGKSKGSGKRK